MAFANGKSFRSWISVAWVLRIRSVRRGAIRRKRGSRGKWGGLRKRGRFTLPHRWGPGPFCGPHACHQEEEHCRNQTDVHHTPPPFAVRPAFEPLPACEVDDVLHLHTVFLGATPSTTVSRPVRWFRPPVAPAGPADSPSLPRARSYPLAAFPVGREGLWGW